MSSAEGVGDRNRKLSTAGQENVNLIFPFFFFLFSLRVVTPTQQQHGTGTANGEGLDDIREGRLLRLICITYMGDLFHVWDVTHVRDKDTRAAIIATKKRRTSSTLFDSPVRSKDRGLIPTINFTTTGLNGEVIPRVAPKQHFFFVHTHTHTLRVVASQGHLSVACRDKYAC